MNKILLIFLCSLSVTNIHAFDWKKFQTLNLQFGTWLENYQQIQGTRAGAKNGFEFVPYLALGSDYHWKQKFMLSPEIGYVLQRNSEAIRKNQFFIRGDLSYLPQDWLKLKIGTSLMVLMISGDGGEDTLPNGDSTETYYIPDERRTALNQTLDFGIEASKDDYAGRLQTYIYAWNESEERMITYTLSFIYKWKTKDLF